MNSKCVRGNVDQTVDFRFSCSVPFYLNNVRLGRDTPHYEPLVPSFGKGVDLRNDP